MSDMRYQAPATLDAAVALLAGAQGHFVFRAQCARYPDLQAHLDNELAVAIDGEIYQDALLQPIRSESEVLVFPKIAGG